ncbi:hypothetical protein DJ86_1662 [Bacillus cereus ATCC 4342]|nr:hypothetical protein BF35_4911 [Bacillus cereus ATCC 4342]KFM88320.1 hypothetical protein DJ86_1662 [Bacillus cereus ATCC 4342]
MEQVIQEFFSPSKNYKVQIIKRKMGYTQRKLIDGWRIVDMNFGVIYHKD